jgi:hypothetical protein
MVTIYTQSDNGIPMRDRVETPIGGVVFTISLSIISSCYFVMNRATTAVTNTPIVNATAKTVIGSIYIKLLLVKIK